MYILWLLYAFKVNYMHTHDDLCKYFLCRRSTSCIMSISSCELLDQMDDFDLEIMFLLLQLMEGSFTVIYLLRNEYIHTSDSLFFRTKRSWGSGYLPPRQGIFLLVFLLSSFPPFCVPLLPQLDHKTWLFHHPHEFSFLFLKSNPFDLNCEKAAVATWLFIICFLIISPDIYNWRLWPLRKRDGSDRIQESASPRQLSSITCSTTAREGVRGAIVGWCCHRNASIWPGHLCIIRRLQRKGRRYKYTMRIIRCSHSSTTSRTA